MTSRDSKKDPSLAEGAASVSIAEIREALARQPANGSSPDPGMRHAAVAIVFAGDVEAPDLCLIRRAERAGDPWSGHMAFPGGKEEPRDASLRIAAERAISRNRVRRILPRIVQEWLHGLTLPTGSSV